MPISLGQFAETGQGKQLALTNLSNLLLKLPEAIRGDQAYNIERQKFGDNDSANQDAFRQLQQITKELGLDASIIPSPQTGQDHDEYLARGIGTFWTAAQGAGNSPEKIRNAATKLTGGGAVPQVQQAQANVLQQQEEAATEQTAQQPLLGALNYGGGTQQPPSPFDALTQTRQAAEQAPAARTVTQQEDPELYTTLVNAGMPRSQMRDIAVRLETDESYNAADAYAEINKFTAAKGKADENRKKAELESKLRIDEDFAGAALKAPGVQKVYDAEGNLVGQVNRENLMDIGIGTGKKMVTPTMHISEQRGGAGGKGKPTSYDKLLNRYNQMSREMGDMAAVLLEPKKLAGSEIAKKYNLKNAEDVQTKLNEIQRTSNMVLTDMQHARKTEGFPDIPKTEPGEESKKETDPQRIAALKFAKDNGWDEAKTQRYLKRLGL